MAVVAGFAADFVAAPYSFGHRHLLVAAVAGGAVPVAAFDYVAADVSFPLFPVFVNLSVQQDLHIPVLLLLVWMR